MVLTKKSTKHLILIVLSILLITGKTNKVLGVSRLPANTDKQIKFLEEKRLTQGAKLQEIQRNNIVEGMGPSKEDENTKKDEAEIENENEIKNQEEKPKQEESDTYSQVVRSIRKLQRKNQESKENKNGKSLVRGTNTSRYYKNSNIPIITSNGVEGKRLGLNQTDENVQPKIQGNMRPNPLLGRLEAMKDLIDEPVINGEPVDMGYSDIEMLEKMVMAESGGEPYLGQVAVTNVILNRVKSNRYPSTLKGVLFQKSQFSPVKNGVIRGRAPNASVKKAVAEALNGRMVVAEDTLYFVNPALATDQTVPRTKTPVKVIGCHTFYK